MAMADERRILVVEDIDDARRTYVRLLGGEGRAVDAAGHLADALGLVEARTYHVALVDIMLAGEHDRSNRDGLIVLKRLQELDEGTFAIVLSGQDEPQLTRDTLKEYGAVDYVDKDAASAVDRMVALVNDALSRVRIKEFGKADNLLSFLAGSAGEAVFVDRCLRALKPREGYSGLKGFFDRLCRPLVPLMPELGREQIMVVSLETGEARGKFWSKALAHAVELVAMRGSDSRRAQDVSTSGELQSELSALGLRGLVFRVGNAARSSFAATI